MVGPYMGRIEYCKEPERGGTSYPFQLGWNQPGSSPFALGLEQSLFTMLGTTVSMSLEQLNRDVPTTLRMGLTAQTYRHPANKSWPCHDKAVVGFANVKVLCQPP
jgi:hypothetical protein